MTGPDILAQVPQITRHLGLATGEPARVLVSARLGERLLAARRREPGVGRAGQNHVYLPLSTR